MRDERQFTSGISGGMRQIARSALVDRPKEDIYTLVERIEDYADFVPGCLDTRVLSRSRERTLATLTLGWRAVRLMLTTENRNLPCSRIEMKLREGPFLYFEGQWRFEALTASACRVSIDVRYEFTNRLIDRALNPVLQHVADGMVDAFVRRAMR